MARMSRCTHSAGLASRVLEGNGMSDILLLERSIGWANVGVMTDSSFVPGLLSSRILTFVVEFMALHSLGATEFRCP